LAIDIADENGLYVERFCALRHIASRFSDPSSLSSLSRNHATVSGIFSETEKAGTMKNKQTPIDHRFAPDAGIAIGPILFIIAILGILAAAIAAGSGSFTAGTQNEGNSSKASALISIGDTLKVGMDRILMDNGTSFSNVVINVNNTSNSNELFSPTGGGISAPSPSMANDPTADIWYYPTAAIPQMGTNAEERLALLQVTQGVCDQVNSKASGVNIEVTNYDNATFQGDPSTPTNDLGNLAANSDWPTPLLGAMVGCVYDVTSNKYWFFQILAIQ
jgi:hypothetical protein